MTTANLEKANAIKYYIASVAMMLDGWSIDKGYGGLCLSDRLFVIRKLLRRAGFDASEEEVIEITKAIIASNPEYDLQIVRDFRTKVNFDEEAEDLCQKFNLPKRIYSHATTSSLEEYALTADIFPSVEGQQYDALIIQVCDDNEKFGDAIEREGGRGAIARFQEKIETRLQTGKFYDPLNVAMVRQESDSKKRINFYAERIVISSNNLTLLGW